MNILLSSLLFLSIMISHIQAASPEVTRALENLSSEHPRLFLNQKDEAAWRQQIAESDFLSTLAVKVVESADNVFPYPPVEREVVGRRMLTVSRIALKRILHLSMSYRLTGDRKYAERAIEEMKVAAAFTDWNPCHYLDTAEMTAALAIGYDWLYHEMVI